MNLIHLTKYFSKWEVLDLVAVVHYHDWWNALIIINTYEFSDLHNIRTSSVLTCIIGDNHEFSVAALVNESMKVCAKKIFFKPLRLPKYSLKIVHAPVFPCQVLHPPLFNLMLE